MTFWTHKRTLYGNQIGSILPSLRAFTGGPVDNLGLTISTFFNLPTLHRSDLAKKKIYMIRTMTQGARGLGGDSIHFECFIVECTVSQKALTQKSSDLSSCNIWTIWWGFPLKNPGWHFFFIGTPNEETC